MNSLITGTPLVQPAFLICSQESTIVTRNQQAFLDPGNICKIHCTYCFAALYSRGVFWETRHARKNSLLWFRINSVTDAVTAEETCDWLLRRLPVCLLAIPISSSFALIWVKYTLTQLQSCLTHVVNTFGLMVCISQIRLFLKFRPQSGISMTAHAFCASITLTGTRDLLI